MPNQMNSDRQNTKLLLYFHFNIVFPSMTDSSVRIVTGLRSGRLGFRVRFSAGAGKFLFTTASRPALRPTQPPIQWVPGALSLGVKRPVREADHSSASSAEVKTAWSYTSTPQYAFMAWCLVKHRDKFTSTFASHLRLILWWYLPFIFSD
jgi:hypothetical protein